MLELAKVIVLREQDVQAREGEIARRRQELAHREEELATRRGELKQLKFEFAEIANGKREPTSAPEARPPLARTMATIAQRVLAAIEMEPRAFTPSELHDFLELPPPIETLRATL